MAEDFLIMQQILTSVGKDLLIDTVMGSMIGLSRDPSFVRLDDRWRLTETDGEDNPSYFEFTLVNGKHAGLEVAIQLLNRPNQTRTRVDIGHRGGRGFSMRYLDVVRREAIQLEMRMLSFDPETETMRPKGLAYLRS